MKKSNTLYWIITGVFGAFMLFTAIPDIMMIKDASDFIIALGYPAYFVPFIGYAKVLGVIAILWPGLDRIKEWAYAGFGIDFLSALISMLVVDGLNTFVLIPIVAIVLLVVSYISYHKIKK